MVWGSEQVVKAQRHSVCLEGLDMAAFGADIQGDSQPRLHQMQEPSVHQSCMASSGAPSIMQRNSVHACQMLVSSQLRWGMGKQQAGLSNRDRSPRQVVQTSVYVAHVYA